MGTQSDMLGYLKVLYSCFRQRHKKTSHSMNIAQYDDFLHCKYVWMQGTCSFGATCIEDEPSLLRGDKR